MKKNILLFGAGKSATVLIDYLIKNASENDWFISIIDADKNVVESKTQQHPLTKAIAIDIQKDESVRKEAIRLADIVISLLPPHLHFMVAKDCIEAKKNLLTASYVDDQLKSLEADITNNNLLFLCEMGLDPGIDHMSAMEIIDKIQGEGGTITSFKSHCGGLVAPESDDNPWHYKISWNPRNVVMAGKAGALFVENGEEKKIAYQQLFAEAKHCIVEGQNVFAYYPNRDSLSYIPIYGLQGIQTFIRTTLRHPDFMYGWNNIIELKLTDEEKCYQTDGMSMMDFFKAHMDKHNFGDWLSNKLSEKFSKTKEMLEKLMELMEAEEEAEAEGAPIEEAFMTVSKEGNLEEVKLDDIKNDGAEVVAYEMHQSNLTLKLLFYLGMDDDELIINKGLCSAADVLQLALEKKLPLMPADKDMIVMQHEFEYELNRQKKQLISSLVVKGADAQRTAMAKTVGLPLGIAAKLILNGTIQEKGLKIPITESIYKPVLIALKEEGICFTERENDIQ